MKLTARQLAHYILDYYFRDVSERNLHIVVEDMNLGNNHLEWCLNLCKEKNDTKGQFIIEQMLLMKKTARGKAIKIFDELEAK